MTVTFETFLTKDPLDNYEDKQKYTQEWLPKVEKYRDNLNKSIPEDLKITLPKPLEELRLEQFNPLQYMYDENLLTKEQLDITESSVSELINKLGKGELTAVAVFQAFAKRAIIAHQLTNCYLDIFIDEGLERAKFLDEYYQKHGKLIGPLHGIPISLKEHMSYKNKRTHAGYVGLIDNITPKHGKTTQILEDLGAVFYVRTTQPQTLMHLCSNNNFIGLCSNPYNASLTAGGSSSGEGASVGFGASPLGVGSDIGGSIRAPAAYSGAFGLRPTTRRVSLLGGVSALAGQESVPAVIGPFGRCVEDIEYWMENYLNEGKPWDRDACAVRMPWRKVETPDLSKLTIGIVYDDGNVLPTPPIQRGLKMVAEKLKAAGAKVVEWKPLNGKLAFETVNKMYACDGNHNQREFIGKSGEPLCKLTKWSLNYGDGAKVYPVSENRKLNYTRDCLRQEYLEFMNENNIDFIISPTYNNVAPKLEQAYNWSYTALWNILDFPTLVFQTGLKVDPSQDQWPESHKDYKYRSALEELELLDYKPESYKDAPIGLQLTGRRYEDEEVVAAGKALVQLIGASILKK